MPDFQCNPLSPQNVMGAPAWVCLHMSADVRRDALSEMNNSCCVVSRMQTPALKGYLVGALARLGLQTLKVRYPSVHHLGTLHRTLPSSMARAGHTKS